MWDKVGDILCSIQNRLASAKPAASPVSVRTYDGAWVSTGTFQATVTQTDDRCAIITTTPLLGWRYIGKDRIPVQVRVIVPGDVLAIQVLPNLQPSWWMAEHIAHCEICRGIVRTHGANALPH